MTAAFPRGWQDYIERLEYRSLSAHLPAKSITVFRKKVMKSVQVTIDDLPGLAVHYGCHGIEGEGFGKSTIASPIRQNGRFCKHPRILHYCMACSRFPFQMSVCTAVEW
jgi:hypothetical protein